MSDNNGIGAIFLDADGVLWQDSGSGGILTGKAQAIRNLELLAVIELKQYLKIVISNQTFAARNKMNYFKFKNFTDVFFKTLIKLNLIDDFVICYHHPNAKNFLLRKKCKCRKPFPGLINSMIEKHNIDPSKSSLVGDRITDIQAGAAAGIKYLFLVVNSKMLEINDNLSNQPLQNEFVPLKGLEEFMLIKKTFNED